MYKKIGILFLFFITFLYFPNFSSANDQCSDGGDPYCGSALATCTYTLSGGSTCEDCPDGSRPTCPSDSSDSSTSNSTATEFHLVPECATSGEGGTSTCTVCDVINTVIGYSKIIMGSLSTMTLLMFVLGGFYWITSSGNEERVQKGKKILIAAITGVIIVAFAWVGVNTIIGVLVGKNVTNIDSSVTLSNGNVWWQFPSCAITTVSDCNTETASTGTYCNNCTNEGATGAEKCICAKSQATTCSDGCNSDHDLTDCGTSCIMDTCIESAGRTPEYDTCETGCAGDDSCVVSTCLGYLDDQDIQTECENACDAECEQELDDCLAGCNKNSPILDGECAGDCDCISLCEQISRKYPTTYGEYECVDTSRKSVETQSWTTLGAESCLSGDLCPHAKGKDPTYKCCKPAD
ncbi:MAG: pilin [Patescibacteria group bacterium]|jgi:hypothetical protein